MLLQLQKYDIRLQYTLGKEMYIADTLSRAYLKDLPNDNESDIEGVNMLSDLPISEQRISEIQQHTLNDEHMQELKEVIQNGWPNRKYDVPPSAMIYFDVRDDLTYFSKWFDIQRRKSCNTDIFEIGYDQAYSLFSYRSRRLFT